MRDFKECINSLEMFDINSSGLHYTWNQKPKKGVGILKKLDRVMGITQFTDCFPSTCAVFQPYRVSDHSPCILKLPNIDQGRKPPFKFANFLTTKAEFQGIVEKAWDTDIDGFNQFRKSIDLEPASASLRDMESVCLKRFQEAVLDEESFLKQKSKVDWLATGGNVSKALVQHYETFLGKERDVSLQPALDLFINVLDRQTALNMIRDVSDEEIKEAMFSISDIKAPGPDGFTSAFFKKSWSIVGKEVALAIHDFFKKGKLLKELNHVILALIPKVTTPSCITDFRTISCCNVLLKCITKIIANGIKESLEEVVSVNQSAFVLGRKISDNILLT
uniref:uncharacterized protein LOC122597015 n=1 Tax=Erigeron canadensis TaxID=72917 RepID=UPI001CB91671|nr:uncharacterized protein LOC122597015 [Erigeron canadensis]